MVDQEHSKLGDLLASLRHIDKKEPVSFFLPSGGIRHGELLFHSAFTQRRAADIYLMPTVVAEREKMFARMMKPRVQVEMCDFSSHIPRQPDDFKHLPLFSFDSLTGHPDYHGYMTECWAKELGITLVTPLRFRYNGWMRYKTNEDSVDEEGLKPERSVLEFLNLHSSTWLKNSHQFSCQVIGGKYTPTDDEHKTSKYARGQKKKKARRK